MRSYSVKTNFGGPCVGSGGRSVRLPVHGSQIGTGDGMGQQAQRREVSTQGPPKGL